MLNQKGFGAFVVVDGVQLPEVEKDGDYYVEAQPGKNYCIRILVPKDKPYGAIITVDGRNAYGRYDLGGVLPNPGSVDKKTDDPDENDLPGFNIKNDGSVSGLFTFVQAAGDGNGNNGIIEVIYFDNAYVNRPVSADRSVGMRGGSDMTTEADYSKTGSVRIDKKMKYQAGPELYRFRIRYGSKKWLADNGITL